MIDKGQRVKVRNGFTISPQHGGKTGTIVRSRRSGNGGTGARVYLVTLPPPDGRTWLNDYEIEVVA